jgi:hypothetical protein
MRVQVETSNIHSKEVNMLPKTSKDVLRAFLTALSIGTFAGEYTGYTYANRR